jgi:predicted RecB family nuclease
MKILHGQLRLAATDVSNHLACRHLTQLELAVTRGERSAPNWAAPDLKVIQELGKRHEAAYLKYLEEEKKLKVARLPEKGNDDALVAETLRLTEEGAEVIAQGALRAGQWFGRPDVLLRVNRPSKRWKWSYEVQDTKLARETKAGTILQLSVYSELLGVAQGGNPEFTPELMWVVTPSGGFTGERYRVAEYAAYFRYVKRQMLRATNGCVPAPFGSQGNLFEIGGEKDGAKADTYPEPVEHCNVCRWFKECDSQRRVDDHLSLVAGIRTQQREQLREWKVETMTQLAAMPIPLRQKPRYGSREGYERVREQARVQVAGGREMKPVHEAILPVAEGMGLCRLPEPSAGDMFVDLEGDPFAGTQGQQYLFGFAARDANGELLYEKQWTLTAEQEKHGFEWLMDEIARRWAEEPGMHVYHYGANEPSSFKRLMGQYATREEQMDRMLRAGIFVDLHRVVKQGLRASVEEYSLKKMEAFYGFRRKTSLDASRAAMRYIEHHLELGWKGATLEDEQREAMEGYNREDCESTAALRDWLESERAKLIEKGEKIARPVAGDPEPPEELNERQQRVKLLVERLTKDLPVDRGERSETQQAQWLLAQLLDWHRREDKATYWEKFRLADLDDDELLDEKAGIGGLQFLDRLKVERKIPTDRYRFEKQETEAREEDDLYFELDKFGTVTAIDFATRTVDIKKTRKTAELHPTAVYLWDRPYDVDEQKDAIFRIGEWVADVGMDSEGAYHAARDLMLRRAPRLKGKETVRPLPLEAPEASANRIAQAMRETVFAIQGPPGAGKTYTGARMICQLVKEGKKIGVTALANKVIRKLLEEVVLAAKVDGIKDVRCMQKWKDGEPSQDIVAAESGDEALKALRMGTANVIGGTSFMWAPDTLSDAVDVLFIDEAGQMALADVISVAHAAKNLVLIGDPQQLERPLKGSHPDGAEKSALEHLLGEHKTILPDVGLLLPETWRLHPNICKFTSELFYEGRLRSRDALKGYVIEGHEWVKGAGLWYVPVQHEGNRNSSAEEVDTIAGIISSLLQAKVRFYRGTESRNLQPDDILIVAPYNAQVSDLLGRLPGTRVGTVDKFQGQEAPVVIYSLTTSSPDDAPRGMEFLYSLNRLNVATSRAMSAVILVGSPKLFEPECRSPRQMQLANALCAYLEMAEVVNLARV